VENEAKQTLWQRWFGGIGWKAYFSAVPFSVIMLLLPLLPTLGVYFVMRQGRAPFFGLALLFFTFGYPVLRVKRPRAAWWVGTLAAVASIFGLLILNIVVATFFGFFAFLTWILAILFTVFNWKKLRWWTFAVAGAIVLVHTVPMGFSRTVLALIPMALLVPYFRLPDRNNFPRAPMVVSLVMTLLAVHGVSFYFDVGGNPEIKEHPAARMVFEYTSQRRGWARTLGTNTRFLTPSCDGETFFVGTKFSMKSGLTIIDPATNKHRKIRMRGGTTDNLAMDCDTGHLFIGNMGANTIMEIDPRRPQRPVRQEEMDGVRVGLLRLDRRADRLYIATSNTTMLHVLRASNLADIGGVEMGKPVTDVIVDFWKDHDVLAVNMGGEIVRMKARTGKITAQAQVPFGLWVYNMALDGDNRRLFVGSLLGRQLAVYDADTLEEIMRVPVRKGERYMQYDPRRSLLYVGNFYSGTITAYDTLSLEPQWSMRGGRRVRYLTLDLIRDQLCFTSQAGGYCLALEMLSPAPPPEPTPEPTPEPVPEEELSTDEADAPEPADATPEQP